MFRSVINFVLIFVKNVTSVSRLFFLFFACGCLVQAPFVESSCSVVLPLLLCQRGSIYVALFLSSQFYSIDLLVSPIPHCVDYCDFIISLDVR